jgi:hypothetical protein
MVNRFFGYDSYKNYISRAVKVYDHDYYAARNRNGILCVYRKNQRMIVAAEWDDFKLFQLIDSPEFVCALTDNWRTNGRPREWGAEYILKRLRETDLHHDPELVEKLDQANAKVDESKMKNFRNQTEDHLRENMSAIRKSFSDINTSTLSKKEINKVKRDKRRFS